MTPSSEGAVTRRLVFRPFVIADLPTVLSIEYASSPFPWKKEFFLSELHNTHSRILIAELDGQIVGYLCRWFVVDEIQILNIAVHPDYRRRGIGRALLLAIIAEARNDAARSISLEVRRSNSPAIALYEGLGFYQTAVRRRYYENGEDALLMVCNVPEFVFPK
jgi:ribosomal-protein-alanine N-acetyltransferase